MPWERTVLLWIHSFHSPGLDRLFLLSRWFGETPVLALIVFAALLWHLARGRTPLALLWLAAGSATLFIGWALKNGVDRARPHLWKWLVHPHDASFPSGHALGTSMVFLLLASNVPLRRPRWRTAAQAAAVLLVVYVGVGRLYLGVHWPTDVLTGWIIGSAMVAMALRLAPKFQPGGFQGQSHPAGHPKINRSFS